MRDIKFRGKRADNGEWVEGYFFNIHESSYIENGRGFVLRVNPSTVGQFTGLKDKNGAKIFEGDVCKIKFDPDVVSDGIWMGLSDNEKKTGSRIFDVENPILNPQDELHCDDIEVIGNIHDNPELIK